MSGRVIRRRFRFGSALVVLPLAAGIACDNPSDDAGRAPDNNEFGVLLDALGVELPACVDAGPALSNGTLTLTLGPGEDAVVSAAMGRLKVNGHQCLNDALNRVALTTTTVRKLIIESASSSTNSVLIDLMPGAFGSLFGPSGGITVNAGNGAAVSFGVRGTDSANRLRMAEAITGGDLYFELSGDGAADVHLMGDPTSVVLTLGGGADTFNAQDTRSLTFQGATIVTGAVKTEPLTIYGGAGTDTIEGGDGNDILDGGDDGDTFQTDTAGTDGADTYQGGAGIDTVDYSSRTAAVTVDIDAGHTRSFVEGASLYGKTLSPGAALSLSVGASGTINYSSAGQSGAGAIITELNALGAFAAVARASADDRGNLVIEAKADDANLVILSDAQQLIGGATAKADNPTDLADADDGATGADERDDVKADIENLKGTPLDDVLTGNGRSNVIEGGAGNDDIAGGSAGSCGLDVDSLSGGAGDDLFQLGAAPNCSDLVDGGPGRDTASYALRSVNVNVTLDSAANDGSGEADNIKATIEIVLGGDGNDVLSGSSANDELHGGPGNDLLKGGAGDDTLVGGTGNDNLAGEAGDDYFDEASASDTAFAKPLSAFGGQDVIHGGVGMNICDYHRATTTPGTYTLCVSATAAGCSPTLNDGPDSDNLTNCNHLILDDGADTVTGSAADDLIEGGDGEDSIVGGAGNDRLFGDAGDDRLFGGLGNDVLDGGSDQVSVSDGGAGDDICVAVAVSSLSCEI